MLLFWKHIISVAISVKLKWTAVISPKNKRLPFTGFPYSLASYGGLLQRGFEWRFHCNLPQVERYMQFQYAIIYRAVQSPPPINKCPVTIKVD
jgi:hypothetical protein